MVIVRNGMIIVWNARHIDWLPKVYVRVQP
jgi:hypothetical protein